MANTSLKHTKENNKEPPDGWHDTEYRSEIGTSMVVGSQGISAIIFFIIFAFNDGAGAFSTFIIGSIILGIVIKFYKYFKTFIDKCANFLESTYKKVLK